MSSEKDKRIEEGVSIHVSENESLEQQNERVKRGKHSDQSRPDENPEKTVQNTDHSRSSEKKKVKRKRMRTMYSTESSEEESDDTDHSKKRKKRKAKQPKRSKKPKKRVSSESESSIAASSSDEWDSLSSSDDSDYAPFDPVDETPERKVPKSLEKFIDKFFNNYIKPEHMQKIKETSPVPDTQGLKVPILEDDAMDLFGEDIQKGLLLKQDRSFQNIQNTLMTTMGPLSELWTKLEHVRKHGPDENEDILPILLEWLQKAVVCIGQTNVHINYYRRLPLVAKLLGSFNKAQSLLKKKSKKMKSKRLLGKKFQQIVAASLKRKKQARELKQSIFKAPAEKKPFRQGPSDRYKGAEGQQRSPLAGVYNDRYENSFSQECSDNKSRQECSENTRNQGNNKDRKKPTNKTLFGLKRKGETSISTVPKQSQSTKSSKSSKETSRKHTGPPRNIKLKLGWNKQPNTVPKTRGSTETIPKKLEENNERPDHSKLRLGGRNRILKTSGTKEPSQRPFVQQKRTRKHRLGDRKTATEGGDRTGRTNRGSVLGAPIPKGEKRRGLQTSVQSKTIERTHHIPPLQNGDNGGPPEHHKTRGFHGENRLKRCILLGPDSRDSQEISKVQMEGDTISVSSDGVRPGTSSPNFHKNPEAGHKPVQTTRTKTTNIPGRSDTAQSKQRQTATGPKDGHLCTGEPRLPNKLGKNGNSTMPGNGISGVPHKHNIDGRITPSKQNEHGYSKMQGHVESNQSDSKGLSKFNRETDFMHASRNSSPPTLSPSPNAKCGRTIEKSKLRGGSIIESSESRRDLMVAKILRNNERQIHPNKTEGDRDNERCIEQRLGSLDWYSENRRTLENGRKRLADKCQGTKSGVDGNKSFYERHDEHSYNVIHGQHNCSSTDQQKIQSSIGKTTRTDERNMGLLPTKGQLSDRDIPTGTRKHNSGQTIQGMAGLKRLETARGSICENTTQDGRSGCRPICQQNEHSDREVRQLETGPGSNGLGQLSNSLDEHEGIRVPSILSHWTSTSENTQRKINSNDYRPNMASTDLVPDSFIVTMSEPDCVAREEVVTSEPKGPNTPLNGPERPETGGMESIRERINSGGLSQDATELLMARWRSGTQVSYESAWSKWSSWARKRQIDPFRATITNIANFLGAMHREGKAYSTINGYRCAISAIHGHIDRKPVGENEQIRGIMTGIFHKNPPTPKYSQFWDVETVLVYIRALGSNNRLILRDLGMKLAMLIALTTANRSSDLSLLDTRFMADQGDKIVFFIKEMGKTRKVGQGPPKVDICDFEDDPDLSPLGCLNEYLTRTEKLRPPKGNNLFLSSVKPFKPIKACTIAGWLKTTLERAGVDTAVWGAHSTRGASTSKAARAGVSTQTILKTACWKRVGTFKKFYQKPSEGCSDSQVFVNSVLRN